MAGILTQSVELLSKIFYNSSKAGEDPMENIFDLEVKEKKAQKNLYRAKTNGRRKSGHMFPTDFMSADEKKEYTKAGEVIVTSLWDQILTGAQYNELTDEKKKQALQHWRKIHTTKAIKEKLGWNDYHLYKEFEKLGIEVEKRAARGTSERFQKKEQKAGRKASVAIAAQKQSLLEFADEEAMDKFYDPEVSADQFYDPFSALKKADPRWEKEVKALAGKMAEVHTTPKDEAQLLLHEMQAMIRSFEEKQKLEAAEGTSFSLNEILDATEAAAKLMKYAAFLEDEKHKFKIRLEIIEVKE
jgi:hypothetical protein